MRVVFTRSPALKTEFYLFLLSRSSQKPTLALGNEVTPCQRFITHVGLSAVCGFRCLLETFQNSNSLLDQINKCLEDYLESKRLIFPRFYFLSNDELLQILAQTRNPLAVQPHLSKCFDAIKALEFGTVQDARPSSGERAKTPSQVQHSNDIIAMLSPDGERVALSKGLKARGAGTNQNLLFRSRDWLSANQGPVLF
eukprot:sb/3470839/